MIKSKQNPKHRVQKRVPDYKETMTWWKIARFIKKHIWIVYWSVSDIVQLQDNFKHVLYSSFIIF